MGGPNGASGRLDFWEGAHDTTGARSQPRSDVARRGGGKLEQRHESTVSGRHGRMETGLAQYLHGYGLSASSPSQGLDPESPQLLFPMGNSTGLAFGEIQPPEVEKLARISGRHTDGQGTVLELGTGVHSLELGPGYASRRPRFQKTAHHFNAITEEKLGGRFSEKLEWPWLVRLHFGCGRGTRRWRPKETMMNGHP